MQAKNTIAALFQQVILCTHTQTIAALLINSVTANKITAVT